MQDRDDQATTLTQRCLALFQLLPTSPPHRCLIAADWLEEEGADVAAAAFREGIWGLDPRARNIDGYSESDGCGDGYGFGNGEGLGDGVGDGLGKGFGQGSGNDDECTFDIGDDEFTFDIDDGEVLGDGSIKIYGHGQGNG